MVTSDPSSTRLALKHVCVDYEAGNGTGQAVCDVSLALRCGEILGLAGESGSGKSTLAYESRACYGHLR